jgi:hypothetical protein
MFGHIVNITASPDDVAGSVSPHPQTRNAFQANGALPLLAGKGRIAAAEPETQRCLLVPAYSTRTAGLAAALFIHIRPASPTEPHENATPQRERQKKFTAEEPVTARIRSSSRQHKLLKPLIRQQLFANTMFNI